MGTRHTLRGLNVLLRAALLTLYLMLIVGYAPTTRAADAPYLKAIEVSTVNYPTVKVTFEALDSNNLPVTGLRRTDFALYENDQEQQVVSGYTLQSSSRPLSVMLALDTSLSMADDGKLRQAQDAAIAFVGQMRPIDRVAVIQFGSSFSDTSAFTSDRTTLANRIETLTASGNTRLYDALVSALNTTTITVDGSKAVVLMTDGRDTESAADLSQVMELIQQTQLRVYTIGVGNDLDEHVLSQIAEMSGGHFYRAIDANDIGNAFRLMSNQLRNRYELVYSSPATALPGSTVELRFTAQTPDGLAIGQTTFITPSFTRAVVSTQTGSSSPQPISSSSTVVGLPNEYAAGVLASLGVLLAAVGLAYAQLQNARQSRLAFFIGGSGTDGGQSTWAKQPMLGTVLIPIAQLIAKLITRLLPPAQVQRISQQLTLAGHPFGWRVGQFVAAQILLAFAGFLFGTMSMLGQAPSIRGVALTVGLALIGYRLPVLMIKRHIKARQRSILRALPDAIDLLTVCVEAGLGLDGAMLEVVNKWDNALSDEFALVLAELKMGRSRREALRGLADRTGVQEVAIFASAMIQADEMGIAIARPLASQADQLRMKRRQRAEKLAHEAGTKIVIVMGLFIMPALFMIILSPAAVQLREIFT